VRRQRGSAVFEGLAALAVMAVLLAITLGLGLWIAGVKCERSWADSGMRARFVVIGGCQVQRKDGTWVPSSAIRELSP
jgi:type IV secretory pathway TrbD component